VSKDQKHKFALARVDARAASARIAALFGASPQEAADSREKLLRLVRALRAAPNPTRSEVELVLGIVESYLSQPRRT
jgi:hypothetical protein